MPPSPGVRGRSPRPFGQSAFTLIELLTVMGVMIIITSIVVANAFGISKGASYSSAREIPFNLLQYAHQRACMDGRTTAACFFTEGDEMNVSLFQVAGRVTADAGSGGSKITDIYSDLAEMAEGSGGKDVSGGMLRVFNFKNGKGFIAKSVVRNEGSATYTIDGETTADGKKNKYRYAVTEINARTENVGGTRWAFSKSDWQKGDQYGFEVSERIALPKDFTYKVSGGHTSGDDFWIFFNSDGSSDTATINATDIKGTSAAFSIQVSNGAVKLQDK